jgi:phosphoribosyl-dephospho-CoA transferase
VVRRRGPGEDGLALGVALPPGGAGRRAALQVAPGTLARLAPPLLLAEAIPSAPADWRPALAHLEAEARRGGLALHLYGSLSWQHLTGLPYLHAGSDVDLLVRPGDAAALDRALALLAAREGQQPRLDGEVVVGGAAVAWRELWAAPARLLVKEEDGASLVPRAALLSRLEREVAR